MCPPPPPANLNLTLQLKSSEMQLKSFEMQLKSFEMQLKCKAAQPLDQMISTNALQFTVILNVGDW